MITASSRRKNITPRSWNCLAIFKITPQSFYCKELGIYIYFNSGNLAVSKKLFSAAIFSTSCHLRGASMDSRVHFSLPITTSSSILTPIFHHFLSHATSCRDIDTWFNRDDHIFFQVNPVPAFIMHIQPHMMRNTMGIIGFHFFCLFNDT